MEKSETKIALIEVPYRQQPRIHWYEDQEDLIATADAYAIEFDYWRVRGFDSPIYDAAHTLARNWYAYYVIQSADDLEVIRNYHGRQKHQVRSLVAELEKVFHS